MKYIIEHVINIFGSFWVIYEDNEEEFIQREVFSSRDSDEAFRVLRELREE